MYTPLPTSSASTYISRTPQDDGLLFQAYWLIEAFDCPSVTVGRLDSRGESRRVSVGEGEIADHLGERFAAAAVTTLAGHSPGLLRHIVKVEVRRRAGVCGTITWRHLRSMRGRVMGRGADSVWPTHLAMRSVFGSLRSRQSTTGSLYRHAGSA